MVLSILAGGLVGYFFAHIALYLKPLGDIFVNLILVSIVPLVFFSITSSVEKMITFHQLGKVFISIVISFLLTSVIAALFMISAVILFPPAIGAQFSLTLSRNISHVNITDTIVSIFTVKDFIQLFSHHHLLPLIFFSILLGLAIPVVDTNKHISQFLAYGSDIFTKLMMMMMYFAPIGFFAYFAVLISQIGPQLFESYIRVITLYYTSALIYFVVAFTLYVYLVGQRRAVKTFWKNIHLPALTSLATCSSATSIPANIEASQKMGVPALIGKTVIPLGAFLHKEGSVLGGVIKIAFLFGIFHMSFAGTYVLLTALMVSLLVGTVMGAIPSGGMLGEMLILSLYDFPPESLMIIATISILIDPLATMINVTGDCVSSLIVMRLTQDQNRSQSTSELLEET